jgi:phosphoribosylamine--glycine ligase
MRVLIVGGGGREHALAWKLRQSPRVDALICAPGNAGIAEIASCVPLAPQDVSGLVALARERGVDTVVIGPELPLTLGLVDRLAAEGIRAFGPTQAAARLEGSKAFTKALLRRLGIPTAAFGVFDDAETARRHVQAIGAPVVVKADGLAAGKGVFVCSTVTEAEQAIAQLMRARSFGAAGARVVVEEFLEGEELSFMALSDGTTVLPLAPAQDYKRVGDGDCGPNTGGMGAYSPVPSCTPALEERVMREVMIPVVQALAAEGVPYRGVLYAGLMVRDGLPRVLEFNVRFGDPECQVLMMRLRSDLAELVERTCEGTLGEARLAWDPRPAVCVVLAAAGYPEAVRTGDEICGLERLADWRDGAVFHAGTRRTPEGRLVTDGGRVLGVTALGEDMTSAIAAAYRAVATLSWPGMHYRRDIAQRARHPQAAS